jgi:hypothetical protein
MEIVKSHEKNVYTDAACYTKQIEYLTLFKGGVEQVIRAQECVPRSSR